MPIKDAECNKIIQSVSNIVDFVKGDVVNQLFEAKNRGLITLDDDQLQKVCNFVESTIANAYVKSSGDLMSTIDSMKKWTLPLKNT